MEIWRFVRAAASQKYVGKYVAVTGCVGTIDASGKYIVLNRLDNSWVESIHCNVNGDEDVINQIAQLSSGSVVTVYGEITNVGEIMGYSMDIHFIE